MGKVFWVSTTAFAIGLLGISLQTLLRKNWFHVTVSRDNFKADYNHTIRSVPTIYYQEGKLSEIISDWHDEGRGQIQLYRLMPGSEFSLDFDILYDGINVTAKKRILTDCSAHPPSVMCLPCFEFENSSASVSPGDVLTGKQDGNEYYASFVQLQSMSTIKKLWEAMKLPPRILKTIIFEHAFISNFKAAVMTAVIHANAFSSSMAVQFVGKKTWIIYSAEVTRHSNMLNGFQVDGIVIPTQSPKDNYDMYVYTSQPGDVLFFADNWGHTVYTHEGPNLMLNFRKLLIGNILRRPIDWLHTILAALVTSNKKPFQNKKLHPAPFKSNYLRNTLHGIHSGLCGDGKLSEWDKLMMDVMMEDASKQTTSRRI
mmetsp:Transcript_25260/g.34730  ORF Transcript_25260/g.34730 Transcript_25260/m.34730 type:complete len:370 (+) Transcript_25260:364-1473(+)